MGLASPRGLVPQGCALGFRVSPLRAEKRATNPARSIVHVNANFSSLLRRPSVPTKQPGRDGVPTYEPQPQSIIMRRTHFERHAFTLTPITPIHVGTGETIEPYEYDLEGNQVRQLVAFDLDAMLAKLNDAQRREFIKLSESANVVALRAWFRKLPHRADCRRFSVTLGNTADTDIAKNLDNPNQLGEIHLLPRHLGTGLCYLPGSSVKGAIRTAVIDRLARQPGWDIEPLLRICAEADRFKGAGAKFEAAVMGNQRFNGNPDLYRDSFRQLAVTDLSVPKDGTFIERIRIRKLQQTESAADPGGIVMYREMTRAAVYGEPQQLASELRLHPQLCDEQTMGRNRDGEPNWLPQRFPLRDLIEMCNAFYRPRLTDELDRFVTKPNVRERLQTALHELADTECLIRLGRHSHFECVTVGEPYRVPPRRGFGATRSLIDVAGQAVVPLGWAKLSFPSTMSP